MNEPRMVKDSERLRLFLQMQDLGSGPGQSAEPLQAQIAPLLDSIITADPLGCAIADRFGNHRSWPSAVRDAFARYAASSEDDVDHREIQLDLALRLTGETSTVTIKTSRAGARVKYVPVLFAKSQEAEAFAAPTTPTSQKDVTIGRYCIWTNRDGKPTSPLDSKFWVIGTESGPFKIDENGD